MSKKRNYSKRERRIVVRGIRRSSPDLHRLSRVLLEFATARAEAEAQAQVPPIDRNEASGPEVELNGSPAAEDRDV